MPVQVVLRWFAHAILCATARSGKGRGRRMNNKQKGKHRHTMERKSRFSSQESDLEQERRAREKQEALGGKNISTLHRDSDFTLECADGRVSPSSSSSPRPPPARSAGQLSSGSGRANRTDISVRYGPSRMNGAPRANGGGQGGREAGLGEFERRLLNAKRLGKAPMPSVDQIPLVLPAK